MDDFFLADPDAPRISQKKRKRAAQAAKSTPRRPKRDQEENSEDEAGAGAVDDMDLEGDRGAEDETDSEAERETAAQKRLRLAKRYLEKVREEAVTEEGEVDAAELDRDIIAQRLRDEALEAVGKLHYPIADKYATLDLSDATRTRTFKSGRTQHALSVTCLAIAIPSARRPTGKSTPSQKPIYIYSASKDASIIKWDFWTGKKLHVVPGALKPTKKLIAAYGNKVTTASKAHNDQILAMGASSDGQYLATGGRDQTIHIWSVEEDKHLGTFKQHRDAIAGLSFRKGQNQLYSASFDRTIKLWNVDEMAYVETLYGHQDQITSIDTLARERCVTSGSRDRTCRMWKIVEESQLIFRGGGSGRADAAGEDLVVMDGVKKVPKADTQAGQAGGSLDTVAMLDEEHFVSGSDTGAISLWNINRKKPLFTKLRAHGTGSKLKFGDQADALPNDVTQNGCGWITALAAVRYSDLFASGAGDGYIRLWKVADGKRRFQMMNCIPMPGFINSLIFFDAPPLSLSDAADVSANKDGKPSTGSRLDRARAAIASGALAKKSTQKDILYLAVGIGQEHRLGRWWRYKGVRNVVKVIALQP